ncbi:hypothetical protein KR054_001504 [Drosophila jambulina]|nr:hypothetical protein KR054_001504 [Drosophila jambulina]
MGPYTCWHCHEYVLGGVITICGHMFCWTCLWPFVADKLHPECPQCQTRLFLHEDIIPFYGEGPNARPEESDFLAEPGAVPRPSGICFRHDEDEAVDQNEGVNEDEDVDQDEGGDQDEAMDQDENVNEVVGVHQDEIPPPLGQVQEVPEDQAVSGKVQFPKVEFTVTCLKWLQVICAILMLLVWCFISLI